jgi:hypothetical protein
MPEERRGPDLCHLLGRRKRQRAEEADIGVVILDDRMTAKCLNLNRSGCIIS